MNSCCAPGRGDEPAASASTPLPGLAGTGADAMPTMVTLEGGSFRMGSVDARAYAADGEGPIHVVELAPFRIDAVTVSNARFATFIDSTGHLTDAERFGWSFVFAGFLPDEFPDTRAVADARWWRQVYGADWRHPDGPGSNLDGRADHPVIHVSWNDAQAYCTWTGTRLPTEAECEYAAGGGRRGAAFPWGDDLEPEGRHLMNVFQGTFPQHNTMADGFAGTAPVAAFPPNGFGLHNMTGNVWEWCADWFDPTYYQHSARQDPSGPPTGTHRVMRGGSYLCHESYCRRYRVSARSANTPDSSTGNLGFRVAAESVNEREGDLLRVILQEHTENHADGTTSGGSLGYLKPPTPGDVYLVSVPPDFPGWNRRRLSPSEPAMSLAGPAANK
jgi:formylglycine-generating enzyme